jgi:hypothetical protein
MQAGFFRLDLTALTTLSQRWNTLSWQAVALAVNKVVVVVLAVC